MFIVQCLMLRLQCSCISINEILLDLVKLKQVNKGTILQNKKLLS